MSAHVLSAGLTRGRRCCGQEDLDDEKAARFAGGGGSDPDGAAVLVEDVTADCQAEPGAAVVACSSVVESDEPVEDPFTIGRGDAGPVVADCQDRSAVLGIEAQVDPARRMT